MKPARISSVILVAFLAVAGQAQTTVCEKAKSADGRSPNPCPARGCAKDGTPEAEANVARKHRPPVGAKLHTVTIDHFEALQISANQKGLQGFAIALGKRKDYTNLKALDLTIGEGDLVALHGFIVGTPSVRRADSANCRLVGRVNNSFRIHIASLPDDTEFDSILVEMIPQLRNMEWKLEKLRRVAQEKLPVRVVGQLFYDSKHVVNSDPSEELTGHPRRLSLWEIHPVTAFLVCTECETSACDEKNSSHWTKLEDMDWTGADNPYKDCGE